MLFIYHNPLDLADNIIQKQISAICTAVEDIIHDIYPGVGTCPYVMTGGTDAKYYSKISDNCIRFAPLYIDGQQYGSIHGLNENIYQGTLPMGVDFYKAVIRNV